MGIFTYYAMALKLLVARKRLKYILTVTYSIEVAGEVHLALEEIEAVIKELTGKDTLD